MRSLENEFFFMAFVFLYKIKEENGYERIPTMNLPKKDINKTLLMEGNRVSYETGKERLRVC